MKKIILLFLLTYSVCLFAQIPNTISFQGRLADATGTAFDDDTYTIHFRLYESESGGSSVWEEYQNVSTTSGLFTTMLGSETTFEGDVDFSQPLWLSIEVVGHGDELSPRYQLGTSPYSFVSNYSLESDIAHSVSWADIEDMPSGFADGIDNTGGDTYTAGDGISISASIISIANYGITSEMLGDMGAEAGQVLKWNGFNWEPENDIGGESGDDWGDQVVSANAPLSGEGTPENPIEILPSSTDGLVLKTVDGEVMWSTDIGGDSGDDWGSQVAITDGSLIGDGTTFNPLGIPYEGVSNTHLAPHSVDGSKISDMGAISGQVLKYNGSEWIPDSDIGGDTGDGWGTQVVETDFSLSGDGTVGSPLGVADYGIENTHIAEYTIEGSKLNDMGATSGQVLKWNGITWEPANDIGGGIGDDWGSQVVESNATLTGNGTAGDPLGLEYYSVEWDHLSVSVQDSILAGGSGGSGDDWGTQIVEHNLTLDGDGTSVSPLQIAHQGALSGEVLKWNGSSWAPGTDEIGASGTGDITGVLAEDGLIGGGMAGEVALAVQFDGTGSASTVARSDHNHDTEYYTQADLSTSGSGASVHWDNITGAPGGTSSLWVDEAGKLRPESLTSDTILISNNSENTSGIYCSIINESNDGYGGYFKNTTSSSNSYGVYGEAISTGADLSNYDVGGLFVARSSAQTGYGVVGYSENAGTSPLAKAYGIRGESVLSSTNGASIALEGEASGGNIAYGLYSSATSGLTNWAGYFAEGNVHVENNLAIGTEIPTAPLHIEHGYGDISESNAVYVNTVHGTTDTMLSILSGYDGTTGVYGKSNLEYGIGVLGEVNGWGAMGARGTAIGERGIGVFADSYEDAQVALFATATCLDTNYAVYGTAFNGLVNWAGYFSHGNVYINNMLGIGANSPTAPLHIEHSYSGYESPIAANVRTVSYADTMLGVIAGYDGTTGLFGKSNVEFGYGVYGSSNGTNSCGARGTAVGENSMGIFASSHDNAQIAMYASASCVDTNYAIFSMAFNGLVNWAGYFSQGNVHISNTLQIGESTMGTHKLTALGSGSSVNGSTGYFENDASDGIGLLVSNTHESSSDVALLVNKKGTGDIAKFDQLDPWDIRFRFTIDGDGRCDGSWTGGGADFAEFFELANHADRYEPGDVVVLSEKGYYVEATDEKYCSRVLGVYTTNPVVVGGSSAEEDPENAIPVGLLGVCPTKVCNENGAIEVGDYLTTSSTPGVAMKATESCVVIGRAMDNYDRNGTEKINVFVNAGWHDVANSYEKLQKQYNELAEQMKQLLDSKE